jgi:hypothetical protein
VKFPSLPQSGDSTTWVRVSQPHTTESVMLPRVGWEALVNAAPGMPVGAVAARTPANPGTGAPGKPGLSVAPVAAIRR